MSKGNRNEVFDNLLKGRARMPTSKQLVEGEGDMRQINDEEIK